MPKVGFSSEIGGWDQLVRSLKDKNLPPIVEDQRLALETAVKDSMALKGEQMRLRAKMLGLSRRMRGIRAGGRQAESRMRAYLKAEYGATSLDLIRHGIRPRARGRFTESLLQEASAVLPTTLPEAPEPAAPEVVAEDPSPGQSPPARSRRRAKPE